MATNYNDAVAIYRKYSRNLLGVISDVGFVVDRADSRKDEARRRHRSLPHEYAATTRRCHFCCNPRGRACATPPSSWAWASSSKNSKTLIHDLGDYISREFAFGDLVFKDPATGREMARAKDLYGLQRLLQGIDDDILLHNISNNHLSKWLLSRGLFALGRAFRSKNTSEFGSVEELKGFCIEQIREYRVAVGQGVIAQFDAATYNDAIWFARIGNGSLGGKARGLAFMNSVLQRHDLYDRWPGVRVMIPRTVVITTEYFDRFIIDNGLQYVINSGR